MNKYIEQCMSPKHGIVRTEDDVVLATVDEHFVVL